jgi:serine/threonine protein kinase
MSLRRSASCPNVATLFAHAGGFTVHDRDARAVVKCTHFGRSTRLVKGREAAVMRRFDVLSATRLDLTSSRHECVARVLDSRAVGYRDVWLTTRYVALPDLHDYLTDFEGGMPWPLIKRVSTSLARAVALCHMHDVTHGDIKPENVMVDARDQRVVLIDFAFARYGACGCTANKSATVSVAKAGTPPFLAPEVATCPFPVTTANPVLLDVYALGFTLLYTALCRRRCLPGDFDQPDCAALRRAGFPEAFVLLVQRCISRVPQCRPTALEVLSGLAACR